MFNIECSPGNLKQLWRNKGIQKRGDICIHYGASLVAQWSRICLQYTGLQIPSLGGEDPLEEGVATHSSILAWRIPWTEEPGGLQSMGSQRVGHDWDDTAHVYIQLVCVSVQRKLTQHCKATVCVRVLVTKSRPTLSDLINCSPPGSSVHGIFWARTLEWAAFPFCRGPSPPSDWTFVSCVAYIAGTFFTTKLPGKQLYSNKN